MIVGVATYGMKIKALEKVYGVKIQKLPK